MNKPTIYCRNSPNEQWKSVPIEDVKRIAESLYIDARWCTALTELKADAAGVQVSLGENNYPLITDLRPWREEMAEAEAIFLAADPQRGDWCTWLHHGITFEKLSQPWRNRLEYIATQKPEEERAWRFRLMRPSSPDALKEALAALRAAK